jgi:hypothetical protein
MMKIIREDEVIEDEIIGQTFLALLYRGGPRELLAAASLGERRARWQAVGASVAGTAFAFSCPACKSPNTHPGNLAANSTFWPSSRTPSTTRSTFSNRSASG